MSVGQQPSEYLQGGSRLHVEPTSRVVRWSSLLSYILSKTGYFLVLPCIYSRHSVPDSQRPIIGEETCVV